MLREGAAMTWVTAAKKQRLVQFSLSLPLGTARTLVAPWVAGIPVADTGVCAVVGAVKADAIMRIAALDPLNVAGDLTQHRAAPRDLGPDHSTIS